MVGGGPFFVFFLSVDAVICSMVCMFVSCSKLDPLNSNYISTDDGAGGRTFQMVQSLKTNGERKMNSIKDKKNEEKKHDNRKTGEKATFRDSRSRSTLAKITIACFC